MKAEVSGEKRAAPEGTLVLWETALKYVQHY